MPTEWTYHADGVQTALTTNHSLDGTLSTVALQLDSFKCRDWAPVEVEEHPTKKEEHLSWDDEGEVYQEFADGSNATLEFSVNDGGAATLKSITPEDGDGILPRHIPLLRAGVRVVEGLSDVDVVFDPIETLMNEYEGAEGIYIDRLDG